MGPTWVLSAPDGPHVGPMNFAIREACHNGYCHHDMNMAHFPSAVTGSVRIQPASVLTH